MFWVNMSAHLFPSVARFRIAPHFALRRRAGFRIVTLFIVLV